MTDLAQSPSVEKSASPVTETIPASFDATLPGVNSMASMKKMQDAAAFGKARFRFRLYPIRKQG